MSLTTQNPLEIQERLRKRYLDRLSERMRKMRKELVDRNWNGIRSECRQLRGSGDSFGFPEITQLALDAEKTIPEGDVSRARNLPETRQAVERLITAIDMILIVNTISRTSPLAQPVPQV